MTRQQRRAWWGLGISIVWVASILVLFIAHGDIETFDADDGRRAAFAGLLLGGALAYALVLWLTRSRTGQAEVDLDERDRAILSRVPAIQLRATLVALVIWAITLTEVYWDAGQIPIIFPYLIANSIFVINLLAYAGGTLVGYRQADRGDMRRD
jgi:hypothetical protein